MRSTLAALFTLPVLLLAGTVAAQETAPPAHLILHTGLFQYELEGEGYSPMLAGRVAVPMATVLMLEGSLLAARPGQDFGTTTLLIPEGQVQLALPFTTVIPYIGIGAGAAIDLREEADGGTQTWVTFAGSLGIKYWIGDQLGAQAEYRARGISSEDGDATNEFGVAVLWRI